MSPYYSLLLPRPPIRLLIPRRPELILRIPTPIRAPPRLIPIPIPIPIPTGPRLRAAPTTRRTRTPTPLGALPLPTLPYAPHDRGGNVRHARHGSDDGVRGHEPRGRPGGPEAQAAVYDAQEHQEAAVPDVGVRDGRAGAVLLVLVVVEEAEGGLEDHCGYDYCSEDRVGFFVELIEGWVLVVWNNGELREGWKREKRGRGKGDNRGV